MINQTTHPPGDPPGGFVFGAENEGTADERG